MWRIVKEFRSAPFPSERPAGRRKPRPLKAVEFPLEFGVSFDPFSPQSGKLTTGRVRPTADREAGTEQLTFSITEPELSKKPAREWGWASRDMDGAQLGCWRERE